MSAPSIGARPQFTGPEMHLHRSQDHEAFAALFVANVLAA